MQGQLAAMTRYPKSILVATGALALLALSLLAYLVTVIVSVGDVLGAVELGAILIFGLVFPALLAGLVAAILAKKEWAWWVGQFFAVLLILGAFNQSVVALGILQFATAIAILVTFRMRAAKQHFGRVPKAAAADTAPGPIQE